MRRAGFGLLIVCLSSAIVGVGACSDDAEDDATSSSSGSTTSSSSSASSSSGGGVCTPGEMKSCYDGPAGTQGIGACIAGFQTCEPDGSAFGVCVGWIGPSASEDCATVADDDCDGDAVEACVCVPGTSASCYEGPAGTENVGTCVPGMKACADDGLSYGACVGQVKPARHDDCGTMFDEDCTGMSNEDCACSPGEMEDCYSGPAGTAGVSVCKAGIHTCNMEGSGFGDCMGEVLPQAETCNTSIDDNCNGQTNESGDGCVCPPNQAVTCYTGPQGTLNVGPCKAGMALCNSQGTAVGACMGEVLPQTETCNTPVDDNCNGMVNESGAGCVCAPNSVSSCYTGPVGTQGVGICKSGTRTCNALGTAFGPCTNEVLPQPSENCTTAADDNCNGQSNEGCAPVSYAASVQPIYQAKCSPCHAGNGSGGRNFAISYADTQLMSIVCPGLTTGACTLVRIQNGSMPLGAGCTGNPTLDAGNAACLTAAQQSTIQSWIAGGQLP